MLLGQIETTCLQTVSKAIENYSFSLLFLHSFCDFILGKQFSLDSRMDLVFHGLEGGQESGDKNHAITEDGEETWEGTKGRYCSDHLRKFRCCP